MSGIFNPPSVPVLTCGRLTLQSGVPVMSTTQSAKTTIFWTPYLGRHIPLWNGSSFDMVDMGGELSQATTDTTKSPAAVVANSNYDMFGWDDAGTKRSTRGPVWSSATARGTGAGTTELELLNGIYVNKNAITNGPAARRGTYLGSVRSNGSLQIDFILPTTHGTAGFIGIWNKANRVALPVRVGDANASYTYSTATVRQIAGSAVNQVSFISGIEEDGVDASFNIVTTLSAVVAAYKEYYVALDSTTGTDAAGAVQNGVATSAQFTCSIRRGWAPQLGFHFISANELGDGANNNTVIAQKYSSLVVGLHY